MRWRLSGTPWSPALCVLISAALSGCSSNVEGGPVAVPTATVSLSEAAAVTVKSSMQHKFDTDPDLSPLNLTVVDVFLVNKAANEYKGIATVKTPEGPDHDVAVDVTADGSNVLWETAPGAFAFAAQPSPPRPRPPTAGAPAGPAPRVLPPSRGGMVYIATKSGKTRCQLMPLEVDRQSKFTNTPYVGGLRANGIRFNADGNYEWVVGDLGTFPASPSITATIRHWRGRSRPPALEQHSLTPAPGDPSSSASTPFASTEVAYRFRTRRRPAVPNFDISCAARRYTRSVAKTRSCGNPPVGSASCQRVLVALPRSLTGVGRGDLITLISQ